MGADSMPVLRSHPALRQRAGTARGPRQQLQAVIDAVREAGTAVLSTPDLEAITVLLGAEHSPAATSDPATAQQRREDAARMQFCSAAHFMHGRPRPDGSTGSPETDLLGRFVDALDALLAPASATSDFAFTTTAGELGRLPEDVALVGTWAGSVSSDWLLKHGGADRPAQLPCYMVASAGRGAITVRWLNRDGTAELVAGRLVAAGSRLRLLAVYEVEVAFEAPSSTPSHRGACLLEGTAAGWSGSYWTDRRTHGTLEFAQRSGRIAQAFDEAAALF